MKYLYRIVFLFLLFSCKKKEETTTPVVQNITESVYASGKVKSKNQYDVYSSVAGIIRKVHVTEGDLVRKGDPLLSLVNESQQLSRENAGIAARYLSVQANTDISGWAPSFWQALSGPSRRHCLLRRTCF